MKKSLKETQLLPITLLLGILGLILRLWLYAAGVDETGLLIQTHPANILSYVLLFLTLGLLVFVALRCPKTISGPFPASMISAMGCVIAAVGLAIANVLDMAQAKDTIDTVSAILGVLTALGLLHTALQRKTGKPGSMIAFTVMSLYLMTHLVVQYRFWSAEPQLQHYMFPLLASVSLMLFAYHRAALDVIGNAFRRYVFLNQAVLFFCCMSLNTDAWLFYAATAIWAATDLWIPQPKRKKRLHIPEPVKFCMETLTKAGFEAYMVGGCVRDSLLDKTPHDYDLCTNALPEEICEVFKDFQLVKSGEKHGTIGVVMESEVYEITTYRTEGDYTDSRHPDWVKFVPNIEADLSRRDFTVNAMAYNAEGGLVDPFEDSRICADKSCEP